MSGEKESSRARAHARSTLVLVNGECRDGASVHGANGTDSLSVGTETDEDLTRLWHDLLDENLRVVSLAVGTVIVA